ncbi:MAG TPA: hypothetical protein VFG20_16950 [Planctomycetaceae bacterium]|jgi:hypothetical protein|nr:hypothetical protein [Planctomycetaceae bacterium]
MDILVYGHGDKSESGFGDVRSLEDYVKRGVFREEQRRYRYSQTKRADIVVLSRDGLAFGHFEIDSMEAPTASDREAYPPVKQVYLVRESVWYREPVRLSDIGIVGYQFGKQITEVEFHRIRELAGTETRWPEVTD